MVNVDGSNHSGITGSAALGGPSWADNTRLLMHAATISPDLDDVKGELWSVDLPSAQATRWATSGTIDQRAYGQFALRQGKLATAGLVWRSPRYVQTLRVWSVSPTGEPPRFQCDLTAQVAGADARFRSPSWAPDGNALVWYEGNGLNDEANEGLQVMAVGDPASTACPGSYVRQLLVSGGSDPHWGPAPVPGTRLTINDISVVEGNVGTRLANFTITRSGVTSGVSTAQWYTANGTAVAPGDFKSVGATPVTFAPEETTKQVSVEVSGDSTFEAAETFFVKLRAPSAGSGIADGTGRGTVVNDDRT